MVFRKTISLVVLGILCGPLWAQRGSGKLEGSVIDETGAFIPGVSVTAMNQETGVAQEAITNDSGNYAFPALPVGVYTVTAEMVGFKRSTVKDVKIDIAAVAVHNFRLAVGEITEEVTVTAAGAEVVQTTTADIANTVDEQRIKLLPLNGRNALELIQLQAGVAGNFQQSERGSASNQSRNVAGLGANGARAVNNAIFQDGADITNSEFGASGNPNSEQFGITAGTDLQVSVDAIEEFRVISLNPTAEFGKNSGMQVEIVTKSGTNDFHGSLYEFHRNDEFNANEFFNNTQGIETPKLIRNQFGGSIGGPVFLPGYNGRNKTFFFFNWEGFRERAGSIVERTVLTQEARNGIFRFFRDGPNSTSLVDPNTGQVLSQFAGRIGTLDVDTLDRTRFEGIGKDTSGAVDRFISLTPLPNFFGNPGGARDGLNFASFRFNANDPVNRFNWVTKIDHQLNEWNSLSGRLSHSEVTSLVNLAPFAGLPGRTRHEEGNGLALSWISSLSTNMINEARLGFSRNIRRLDSSIEKPGDIILDCDSAFDCLGITNPDLTGEESFTARQTLQVTDNFTWKRGDHEFKFGYTFRSNPLNVNQASRQINLDFNTEPRNEQGSVVDLAALLGDPIPVNSNDRIPAANFFNFITGRMGGVEGIINAISTQEFGDFSAGRVRGFRQREHSWFVQDSWRVTSNFSLNLGVRHEIYLVPYEVNSFFTQPSNVNLITRQLAPPGEGCNSFGKADALNKCTLPLVEFDAIGPKFGTRLYDNDFNNFAPVVGFSWDPFGSGKTAIRASYRIAYDKLFTSTLNSNDTSAPGLRFESVINGDALRDVGVTNFIAPGGSLAGQGRPPRLSDLKGTSVGGINLNGSFDLAKFLSTPGVNIPAKPLGPISQTRQSLSPDSFSPDFTTAYAQSWSLGIQHEIMKNTIVEARYIGRKGVKEYLGLPANEFRSTPAFDREIQMLQFLVSGGALGLQPPSLPPGFQMGKQIPIGDLFGKTPNTATNISQFKPGTFDAFARQTFPLLWPFFLAGQNAFDSTLRSALLRNDYVSTIASFDNRTNFHNNDFLISAGLNPCPPGRDPNRQRFGCLPIIVGLPETFFRATPQFLNGPRSVSNAASSDYHGLQLELRRRMTDGLQVQVNYTYAKLLDVTSVSQPTGQDIVSFNCILCDRGLSDNDIRHDFKFNYIWEIPVGRGRAFGSGMRRWVDNIAGGWTVAGFLTWSNDFPMNIAANGRDRTAPATTAGIRPSFDPSVKDSSQFNGIGDVDKRPDGVFFFDPKQFDGVLARTLIGRLGDVPRNFFRGPGWFNMDFMVMKTFDLSGLGPLGENWRLDFRAEFFNFFNHVNFANPSLNADRGPFVDLSKPDAGKIIDTLGNPRLIQFALKLRF